MWSIKLNSPVKLMQTMWLYTNLLILELNGMCNPASLIHAGRDDEWLNRIGTANFGNDPHLKQCLPRNTRCLPLEEICSHFQVMLPQRQDTLKIEAKFLLCRKVSHFWESCGRMVYKCKCCRVHSFVVDHMSKFIGSSKKNHAYGYVFCFHLKNKIIFLTFVVVVVVYFPNCNRHTADKYIFSGVQFVVIPSEQYSCDLWSEYGKQALRYIGDGSQWKNT